MAGGDEPMAASGEEAEEQYEVTREFVEAMMTHFKEQKKIPLRYVLQILLEFQVGSAALGAVPYLYDVSGTLLPFVRSLLGAAEEIVPTLQCCLLQTPTLHGIVELQKRAIERTVAISVPPRARSKSGVGAGLHAR